MPDSHIPTLFTRHNIHLHALLLENQAWFCAHDLGRLMGKHLDERTTRKLDADQRQLMIVDVYGAAKELLMVSESGAYALLVYHYCPENRLLREWLTHQVVPALRDARPSRMVERPTLSVLDWPQMSLGLLHWQNEPWIRLRDMPCVLADDPFNRRESWWRKASRVMRGF
ncbi:BRO-N domain-containing protein [Pseudomonas vancouverensis]|uniref:Phage antirepressor protein n=1 Tax=Pseudomonas vancouverensis TaxID=95300 RepID=A0A1H2M9C7_PSEVA|nr:Bro-N domain-containing protein [Pseudomonas vancouverensis]KAB0498959.1 Bro-N domain-containing protein [Pseudomonas vancouverensis]TDB57655.1 phage antirepressor protein [Pseudomonas vancouverensis]SDU89779.1 Prophage antirepressor [Pseudomonas vancouverensis]